MKSGRWLEWMLRPPLWTEDRGFFFFYGLGAGVFSSLDWGLAFLFFFWIGGCGFPSGLGVGVFFFFLFCWVETFPFFLPILTDPSGSFPTIFLSEW